MRPVLLCCSALRWMLHGNFAPAVAEALVRHGHAAPPLEEAAPTNSGELLKLATRKQLDVLTNDRDFIQHAVEGAPEGAKKFNRSIVYLQLEGGDVEQDDAIDRLFTRYKRLKPGMLYTVTESRVKVRQLPGL